MLIVLDSKYFFINVYEFQCCKTLGFFTYYKRSTNFENKIIPFPDHKCFDYKMVCLLLALFITPACYKGIDEFIIVVHWKNKCFFGNAYQTVCVLIHQRLFNHFDVRECNRRSQQTLYIFLTIIYHIFVFSSISVCSTTLMYENAIGGPSRPCIFFSL